MVLLARLGPGEGHPLGCRHSRPMDRPHRSDRKRARVGADGSLKALPPSRRRCVPIHGRPPRPRRVPQRQ